MAAKGLDGHSVRGLNSSGPYLRPSQVLANDRSEYARGSDLRAVFGALIMGALEATERAPSQHSGAENSTQASRGRGLRWVGVGCQVPHAGSLPGTAGDGRCLGINVPSSRIW